MSITKNSKGFTILEMLIAMVLSLIVMTGVYTAFNSVLSTKEASEKSYYENSLLLAARKVIKPDLLQMYKDSLQIENLPDNDKLSLMSNNSIKMEKAFPVTVRYYVDDGYLVREESSAEHEYEWKLYLLRGVSGFNVQSHNGYRFTDEYDNMDTIIKVSFKVGEHPVEFIAGCGHLSRTGDYGGEVWQ